MGPHEKSRETGRRRVTVALGGTASSVRTENAQEHQTEVREHRRNRRDVDRTPTALDGWPQCPGEAWRDGASVTLAVDAELSEDHVDRP